MVGLISDNSVFIYLQIHTDEIHKDYELHNPPEKQKISLSRGAGRGLGEGGHWALKYKYVTPGSKKFLSE